MDHSETSTYKCFRQLFWYQHKLDYYVYSGHIKIQIFGVITLSKETDTPMV